MEKQNLSSYVLVHGCTPFNEVEPTNESLKMNDLSEETKNALLSVIDKFLLDISLDASGLTLYSLVNSKKSINMELFSQNIEEYIYFMVAQSVTTSYNRGIENIIQKFCEILIKVQDGLILNNQGPYDLKFQLKNGEEYWIDIKSINEQKNYDFQTIKEHKEKAEKAGVKYRFCIYDDENQSNDDYILNGIDFWELIAGFENAKLRIFRLINGTANKLSISTIIKETKNRFLQEWRMQD